MILIELLIIFCLYCQLVYTRFRDFPILLVCARYYTVQSLRWETLSTEVNSLIRWNEFSVEIMYPETIWRMVLGLRFRGPAVHTFTCIAKM